VVSAAATLVRSALAKATGNVAQTAARRLEAIRTSTRFTTRSKASEVPSRAAV
jgi:hypothetical protein